MTKMKPKYWIPGILGLAVFLTFSVMTFFRIRTLQLDLATQINRQKQALAETYVLGKNLLTNIRLEQMKFDVPVSMPEDSGRVVILFPEEVCDICYRDLFNTLKELPDRKKERIVAVVPVRFKRNFEVYNQTYGMNLHRIIYSDSGLELSKAVEEQILIFTTDGEQGIHAPLIYHKMAPLAKEYLMQATD